MNTVYKRKFGGMLQLLQGKGCMNSHDNYVMQTKIFSVNDWIYLCLEQFPKALNW
jgi:hypothetical protein